MKCSYCFTDFHPDAVDGSFEFARPPRPSKEDKSSNNYWKWRTYVCAACFGPHILLEVGQFTGPGTKKISLYRQIHPLVGAFQQAPPEVPLEMAADYAEANNVLSVSPKASAALSRRCLQAILSNQGYVAKDLVKQVEAVLSETDTTKSLPVSIQTNIDAIRNFGNFSAHPITDLTTLQIVGVEHGEAEWCLQLLLDLFEHYYVAPVRAAERRQSLATKLAAAGKPPMKSIRLP